MQNKMQTMMQLQQQQQQQVATMMALVGRLLQEKKYQELFKTACLMSSTVKVVLSYVIFVPMAMCQVFIILETVAFLEVKNQ